MEIWKKTEHLLEKNSIKEAKDMITEGKKLTQSRIKLIRLADREGWAVANAYISDDLASDTEDEKRIQRAVRTVAASTKAKIKNKKPYAKSEEKPQQATKGKTQAEAIVCWTCGKNGHISVYCPNNDRLFVPSKQQENSQTTNDN